MPTTLPSRRPGQPPPDRLILSLFAVLVPLMGLALIEPALTNTSAPAGGDENPFQEIGSE